MPEGEEEDEAEGVRGGRSIMCDITMPLTALSFPQRDVKYGSLTTDSVKKK